MVRCQWQSDIQCGHLLHRHHQLRADIKRWVLDGYKLTIEGCAPADSNIVVRLRRDVAGTLAPNGMNGYLILQAADAPTSGFTNLPAVMLTGADAFDATGHRNYTNAVNTVRKFYKAVVQ